MGGRKKLGSHLFLVIGIAVIFGLSSTRCGEKSSQTGKTGETGKTEEECPVWFKDADKDGYTDGTTKVSCENPSDEYVSSAKLGDCNDNDPNINPGKTEICDGKDNNCNGQIDEGFNLGQSCSVGVGECARTGQYVCKADGTGTECNATPGTPTPEICDGKDNDCDGYIDEGVLLTFYRDQDGDGYGDANNSIQACTQPTGYVSNSSDCNDNNASVNPMKSEFCNRIDDNCNGQIDEDNVCGKVSTGGYHTCAVKTDGSLWCWGWNYYGQLGDGTNTSRTAPVRIMSSGVSYVALGWGHTCAIKIDGSLWCWGLNYYGQLGDGTNSDKNTPVQIMSSGVSSVALGYGHTCAIKQDSSLWCWGSNSAGEVGDGTLINKNTPVQIMSGVSYVAAGGSHTCAIKQDSSLWCWGSNSAGQIGDGTWTNKNMPVQIMSGVSYVALGGYHTCAVKTDGSLWCWGHNYYGQLGDGTNTFKNTPVQIMSGVSYVAAGDYHTCAIKTDGSLWCWGYNVHGQVGDGSAWRITPVYIMNLGSGGGGAPYIREEISFGNREQKQANMEQKQIRYGCSSANIVFYIIYLIFSAFILFALCKRGFVRN
jgi:alpha-tubulin suppressor-like RCC1 family protein